MRTRLKGKFGQNDSETKRGMVIAYPSEQGYLKNSASPKESNMLPDKVGAIVDTLEAKGVTSAQEIDRKIRIRVTAKKGLAKLED